MDNQVDIIGSGRCGKLAIDRIDSGRCVVLFCIHPRILFFFAVTWMYPWGILLGVVCGNQSQRLV